MFTPTRQLIRERMVDVTAKPRYKPWKHLEGCQIEHAEVEGANVASYRLTTDIQCSLSTFRAFITAPKNTFLFDTSVDTMAPFFTDDATDIQCFYSKYKAVSFVTARDFCSWLSYDTVPWDSLSQAEQRMAHQIRSISIKGNHENTSDSDKNPKEVFIYGSIDSDRAPQVPQLIRGQIHAFGYIAFQISDTVIRVTNINCVDPKGNIPSFALDGANAENAKKLNKIKDMCVLLQNVTDNIGITLPHPPKDLKGEVKVNSGETHKDPLADVVVVETHKKSSPEILKDTPKKVDAVDDNDKGDLKEIEEKEEEQKLYTPTTKEEIDNDPQPENADVAEEITPIPPNLVFTDAKKPHFQRMMSLHNSHDWVSSKSLDNCLLEEMKVDFSHIKATRISSDFKCSIESFVRFMGNLDNQKQYDTKVEIFEVLNKNTEINGIITYSAYKRETRWISPRDFCCHSAGYLLTDADTIRDQGFKSEIKKAYVSNTVSIADGKPAQKDWVRGFIHVFGYICTTDSMTSNNCKVYSIACVDPAGSLPGAVMDAMNVESCKKLALIRKLCEDNHNKGPAEFIGVPTAQPEKNTASPKKSAKASFASKGATDTLSNDSFESCLDEEEVKREVEDLKEFYTSEVNAICRRLTALHNFRGWSFLSDTESAKVETVLTPLSEHKAVRVSLEAECTLEDFWCVISNVKYTRKYDSSVDKLELLQSPPYGSVIYTSYSDKGAQPRDFCTITASKFLTEREGSDAQLYTEGIHSSALVINSVDFDGHPEQEGIIRGSVLANGFIAIATPPTARRIRIFYISLIDPKGGHIPSKVADAISLGLSEKTAAIARLAEAFGRGELRKSGPHGMSVKDSQDNEDVDEDRHLYPLLQNQALKWSSPIGFGNAQVDTATLPPNTPTGKKHTIVRASIEMQCTLATFENAMMNSENRRKYEPEIELLRFEDGPSNATISTCCYKKDKKHSVSNGAFSEVTVSRKLSKEEIDKFHLVTKNMKAAVYAANTSDWPVEVAQSIIDDGFTAGHMVVNGFIAVAVPPEAKLIRVCHHWCATVGHDDEDHQSTLKHAQQETANRVIRLAALCQNTESVKSQAFFTEEEDVSNFRKRTASVKYDQPTKEDSPTPSKSLTNSVSSNPATKELGSPKQGSDLRGNRIYSKLLGLMDRADWNKGSVVEGCLIETTSVEYSSVKAVRISTMANCSLETLRDFLKDESNVRKYDTALNTFQIVKQTDESVILYTNYKRQSMLVAPRDFVSETASKLLTREESLSQRLTTAQDNKGVFIQSSVSANGMKEPTKDWVRGTIYVFGYLAIAESSKRIQFFNYSCVDPSGNIPKWVTDASTAMSAKTVATIRGLCEEMEKNKDSEPVVLFE